jgi:hypothetical protein
MADMPVEIIVNDDASTQAAREELYKMSNLISVTVFNNGLNMGLNEAVNRCVEMASSKYILFICDDCYITRPCFRQLCEVLEKPYIGTVSLGQDGSNTSPEHLCHTANGGFSLLSGLGCGSTTAFRKDVWKEVSGWDTRGTTGQSDNVFIHKIHKAGYWRGLVSGQQSISVGNFVEPEKYESSFESMRGNDCSLPRIFGLPKDQWVMYNHLRRESAQWWVDGERTLTDRKNYEGISFTGQRYKETRENPVAGLNDIPYWLEYFHSLFGGQEWCTDPAKIVWENAKTHGQDKWKDFIVRDFGLEK